MHPVSHHPSKPSPRSAPIRRQRGVITIVGAFTLLMALMFAVLAVDTGRLWMERRNVQKIADVTAMATARYTQCGSTLSNVTDIARSTATANGLDLTAAGSSVAVTRGHVAQNAQGISEYSVLPEPTDTSDSVQVTINKTVPASLVMGGWIGSTVQLAAQATAKGSPAQATFALSGSLLNFDVTQANAMNALLGAILGGKNPTISADSYNALAGLNITLTQLMQATGLTASQLMNNPITVSQATQAILNGATSGTVLTSGLNTALTQLLAATNSSGQTFQFGNVVDVNINSTDGLNTNINVLGLLMTSIQVAGANQALALNLGVPGVAAVEVDLLQAPKIAIGPAGRSATTNQWCTQARTQSASVAVIVAPKFLQLLGLIIDLKIAVKVAPTTAHIDYIQTTPDNNGDVKVDLGVNTGLVTLTLSNSDESGPGGIWFKPPLFDKVSIVTFQTDPQDLLASYTPLPVSVQTPIQDHLPSFASGSAETSGVLQNALKIGAIDTNILGIEIPVSKILKPINDFLSSILSSTIDPILRGLGINLGAANVMLMDIKSNTPQLVI
jgi:uncharacterized membrane protein